MALVVGDAMGHGPEAAAVVVQLRTATHLLAGLDVPPAELLASLDTMVTGMPASPYATCICAVIDTGASTCVIAAAGHPPPVLALADGRTEVLAVPAGLPLGLVPGPSRWPGSPCRRSPARALYRRAGRKPRPAAGRWHRRVARRTRLRPGSARYVIGRCPETICRALRQRGGGDITLVLARIRQ